MTTRTGKELWQIARRHFLKEKADEVVWKCSCGWTNSGKESFIRCGRCGYTSAMRKFVKIISRQLEMKELAKVISEKKKKKEVPKFKISISDTLFY